MKTIGRGRDYKRALLTNLVRSLNVYKRIITTRAKGTLVKRAMGRKGEQVALIALPTRRGDNASQVLIELNKHEHRTDKNKTGAKKVASH